jgi:hypothetical protein
MIHIILVHCDEHGFGGVGRSGCELRNKVGHDGL